jgi:penicillin G amidase
LGAVSEILMMVLKGRRGRASRLVRWVGLGLLLLVSTAFFAGWLMLRASLPDVAGTLRLSGLKEPVRVVRDAHGIPRIDAANEHDLYMALGFVHAQDRLFQMDLQRRLGSGRLAEIFGPSALGTDRTMRTLGLYRHAEAGVAFVSLEFREILDAYAAGVNAFLQSGKALPIEFTILNYRPAPWEPADSLVVGKLLALQLTGNYGAELRRARMAQILSADELNGLFPQYPADAPVTLGKLAALTRDLPLTALLQALPYGADATRASNNWVVDGLHSRTGKPLLANDPHLDYGAPLVWYLAQLNAPNVHLAGGTVAGAPTVVLGHNDRIAWGYTTTNADAEDLFVEKADPNDPGRYLVDDGSAAFEVRQEQISVKGQPPVTLDVRSTHHGPIISDALDGGAPGGGLLALQASFLVDDDRSVEAQWRASRAVDWQSWQDALRLFIAPVQNMVYADRDGNIGFMAPGRIPIRKAGDGRAPVPGWHGDHDWVGFVPFEKLPQAFNPPAGHIATANNKIIPDSYPYLITRDWDLPFRIERIEAGLAETPQQSIESSARIQADIVSLSAKALLPLLLAAEPRNARAAAAIDLLRHWDARMSADRPEPLIFAAWLSAVNEALFAPKLGAIYSRHWKPSVLVTVTALKQHGRWCDATGCGPLLQASLDNALDWLAKHHGDDMSSWRWGKAHQATFRHPFFTHIPVVRMLFDRHAPADGANDTVNAGGYSTRDSNDPFADEHGPGLRAIYDMANLDASVFQMALGQSAHVLSPHYDDLQVLWRRFEWVRLSRDFSGDILSLEPERASK